MHAPATSPENLVLVDASSEDAEAVAELVNMASGGLLQAFTGRPVGRRMGPMCREAGHAMSVERAKLLKTADGTIAAGLVTNLGSEKVARDKAFEQQMRKLPLWRMPMILLTAFAARHVLTFMGQAPRDALYIDAIAVKPEFRRRGLATRLLDEAKRQATDAGVGRLVLDADVNNRKAIAAYEQYGFEVASTSPGSGDKRVHRMALHLRAGSP